MKGSYLTYNLAHNKHVTTQTQAPLQNASRAFSTANQLSLKCLYTNAQSICNKFDEFKSYILQHSPKIIAITESWCNESINDSEIHLDNYKVYRSDKQSGRGGGVLLYIHCSLNFTPCGNINNLGISDSFWGTIKLTSKETLLVGVVYRSPS